MRLQHFLITRFSIRAGERERIQNPNLRSVAPLRGAYDALEPARLEFRLNLFEITCAPSVMAQTSDNFTWVIAVDPSLARPFRDRLRAQTSQHPRVILHDYDPDQPLAEVEWLKPYLDQPAPESLLTSNLDDDDALPQRFIEELQRLVVSQDEPSSPVQLFGATNTLQWDLDVSRRAPLGYRGEWHRDRVPVSSCGFSLLAPFPQYPLTVMRLGHPSAHVLLDWHVPLGGELAGENRELIEQYAARAGDDLHQFGPERTFHDYGPVTGLPVQVNHTDNAQGYRLYERKQRTAVVGPESFPGVTIDWDRFRQRASVFRRSRFVHLRYLFDVQARRVRSRLRRWRASLRR